MPGKIKERDFRPEDYLLEDIHAQIIDRGITFKDVAHRMGMSRANVSNIFARNRNPHIQVMMQLADVVGLKIVLVEKS